MDPGVLCQLLAEATNGTIDQSMSPDETPRQDGTGPAPTTDALGFYFMTEAGQEGRYDAALKQIDLDLSRTLPTNKHFDNPDSEMLTNLRNVLYAYRFHNQEVGYCQVSVLLLLRESQGLNRLAAIGLLYLPPKEAFWFLAACVEKLQPPGYYTTSLIGAAADQRVLRDLVTEKLPRIATHLKTFDVDVSLFTLSWFVSLSLRGVSRFLTIFVDLFKHSIYLHIFDVFLNEGNKVLFRFALAVLKLSETEVLKCSTVGMVHKCLNRTVEHVTDYKALAKVAFEELNPFPMKSIESKRQQYLRELNEARKL